jgi:hypothetical protein
MGKSRLLPSFLVVAGLALAAAMFACGGADFDPQSVVDSVRIFGVRPDKPFASPGDTVTLEVLAADRRKAQPRPMKIFWIPIVCLNPREDLYYLCFGAALPGDAGATLEAPFPGDGGATLSGDAGATVGGSPLQQIPTNVDLGPLLHQGNTFSFQMPPNAIQPRDGTPPYGLAIVFNIACAGQVRLAERSGENPQQVPILCTDEQGAPLSPSDYVIGINRVYSYANQTNTNPVVDGVTLDGNPVDLKKGITLPHCVAKKRIDCDKHKIDVHVTDASWEPNPTEGAPDIREQIWATYYSDIGDIENDARLLFDTRAGRVDDSGDNYRAPYDPSEGTLWVVVHDNRAGAAFVVLPLHITP